MRNEITEFSFAYAFTEEFVRYMDYELDFAPYIPNLKEEGKVSYDLKVSWGIPLFIQFKLSEFIKVLSSRVKEYNKGIFTTPFYRFELRTYKDDGQHNKLVDLNASGEVVSYVAPIFHELDDFNNFYLSQRIIDNSIILEPKSIGKYTDRKSHHISFTSQTDSEKFSEPERLEGKFDFRHFRQSILNNIAELKEKQIKLDEGYWTKVETRMREIIQKHDRIRGERIIANVDAPVIERVNFLSRTYFNTEMFVASIKDSDGDGQNHI